LRFLAHPSIQPHSPGSRIAPVRRTDTNNLCENAIRPTAIGKKNFLFIGHPEAGARSAMVYSILGSCRRRGVNPAKYLLDVLKRLPDLKAKDIPSLTPGAWAKAHPEACVKPTK
jgi:hypothetical protein